MNILLIILLVFLLGGGGGYGYRAGWGTSGYGTLGGGLVTALVIVVVLRLLGVI